MNNLINQSYSQLFLPICSLTLFYLQYLVLSFFQSFCLQFFASVVFFTIHAPLHSLVPLSPPVPFSSCLSLCPCLTACAVSPSACFSVSVINDWATGKCWVANGVLLYSLKVWAENAHASYWTQNVLKGLIKLEFHTSVFANPPSFLSQSVVVKKSVLHIKF